MPKGQCYIQFLTENAYITFATAMFAFYIPVAIMAIFYGRIYILTRDRQKQLNTLTNSTYHDKNKVNVKLSKRRSSPNSGKTKSTGSTHEINKAYQEDVYTGPKFDNISTPKKEKKRGKGALLSGHRKAAQMLATILLAYFITWLPYDIFALMQPFCPTCIPNELWSFGYWFCYVNSTVNPFCYAFGNKDFRRVFKRLLFCKKPRKEFYSSSMMSSQASTNVTETDYNSKSENN